MATSCIRLIFEVFLTCLKSIEENSSVCYHRTRQRNKNQSGGVGQLKESIYKTYEDLPLFLNAATVAKVLGVSPSSGYELMHEPGFPVLKTGSRMVVPKEQFICWVKEHTGGGA